MNSLKFVEEEIEQNKRLFERYTNHLLAFPSSIIENRREQIREELTYLQQIKTELKAWEICKNKLNLKVQTEEAVTEVFCMKGYWLLVEQYPYTQTTILEQEEYEILKKALEVKE